MLRRVNSPSSAGKSKKKYYYFRAGLTKNSKINAKTNKKTPSTKRLAVKLGKKYKSKKATATPVSVCTSACGFLHS